MDTSNKHERRMINHGNRAITGLILILGGIFLLLRNSGIFPDFIEHIVFSWQMLLIVIGLLIALGASSKIPGLIVMSVGVFFLIPAFFPLIFGKYNLFWPAVLIILGLAFITGGKKISSRLATHQTGDSTSQYIDVVNIFGGGDRQIATDNFRGGSVTSVFGGSKIDLTQSKLAPGVSQLDITCVFGGTELIVPEEWNIIVDITPVLGGFSDERKIISGLATDHNRKLVIKGVVIFGGGDMKTKTVM